MNADLVWVWASTGVPILASVTDWDTPAGSPGTEMCLMIFLSMGHRWRDDNCDNLQRFVCEIKYELKYDKLTTGVFGVNKHQRKSILQSERKGKRL